MTKEKLSPRVSSRRTMKLNIAILVLAVASYGLAEFFRADPIIMWSIVAGFLVLLVIIARLIPREKPIVENFFQKQGWVIVDSTEVIGRITDIKQDPFNNRIFTFRLCAKGTIQGREALYAWGSYTDHPESMGAEHGTQMYLMNIPEMNNEEFLITSSTHQIPIPAIFKNIEPVRKSSFVKLYMRNEDVLVKTPFKEMVEWYTKLSQRMNIWIHTGRLIVFFDSDRSFETLAGSNPEPALEQMQKIAKFIISK